MMQVAQAGSQGDKKARRVLSLRAHHLKETLLKAKTDLKAHKATARQQAYKIGPLSCILKLFCCPCRFTAFAVLSQHGYSHLTCLWTNFCLWFVILNQCMIMSVDSHDIMTRLLMYTQTYMCLLLQTTLMLGQQPCATVVC